MLEAADLSHAQSSPSQALCTYQQYEVSVSAAPVHQLTEYYRYGKVDDCLGHWNSLWDCLKQRTRFAEQASSFETLLSYKVTVPYTLSAFSLSIHRPV